MMAGGPSKIDGALAKAIHAHFFSGGGGAGPMAPTAQTMQGRTGQQGAFGGFPQGYIGAVVPQTGANTPKAPGATSKPQAPQQAQLPIGGQPPGQFGGGMPHGLESIAPMLGLLAPLILHVLHGFFSGGGLGGMGLGGTGQGGAQFGGNPGIGHGSP